MKWFWRHERFSWSFVLGMVYSTLAIVVFDYAWRTINAPFHYIFLAGAAIYSSGLLLLYFLARSKRRCPVNEASIRK